MSDPSKFCVGGAVQAGRAVYIQRRADEELLRLCLEGVFAYVLDARQVGKTSLLARTAEKLQESNVRIVFIDMQRFGAQVSADEWYLGQLLSIEDDLMLATDVYGWWKQRPHVSPLHRMLTFFRDVLLREVSERVVIFIDEIDITLSLPFADDYFAAIRTLYNARATEPEFGRLSFVVAGTATPGDLVADTLRTPFNIGTPVKLDDFTFDDALPLSEGFGLSGEAARELLGWVLKWSGGHPYITQRICRLVADARKDEWSEEELDELVRSVFLKNHASQDNNLLFVRDMLIYRRQGVDVAEILQTYRKVLRGHDVSDDPSSSIISHLKLSGVVKSSDGQLQIRNRIYREAFNEDWVKSHMPHVSVLKRLWKGGRR